MNKDKGFSLVELLIVVAIIGVIAAVVVPNLSGRDGGARLSREIASRVIERRAAALRLNPLVEPTSIEAARQTLIGIDFNDLTTTAPLVADGVDVNGDFIDDNTGKQITVFTGGAWAYSYQGSALRLPLGWRFGRPAGIPAIGNSTRPQIGVPQLRLFFDGRGRVFMDSNGDGVMEEASGIDPARYSGSIDKQGNFIAVYFNDGTNTRAVGVHPTGAVEEWVYNMDDNAWHGFGNRLVGVD